MSADRVTESHDGAATYTVSLTTKPMSAESAAPIACTLDSSALRGQLEEWQRLLNHVASREPVDGGVRATFAATVSTNELIRLVAAEQDCCQFLRFAITVDTRGIALEVRAPSGAQLIVDALFGTGGERRDAAETTLTR